MCQNVACVDEDLGPGEEADRSSPGGPHYHSEMTLLGPALIRPPCVNTGHQDDCHQSQGIMLDHHVCVWEGGGGNSQSKGAWLRVWCSLHLLTGLWSCQEMVPRGSQWLLRPKLMAGSQLICSQGGRLRTSESQEQQIPSLCSPSSPPEQLWPTGPGFLPCDPSI